MKRTEPYEYRMQGRHLPWETETLLQLLLMDLVECCDAETTVCREHWSADDATHGQGAVFALIVQDYFGGDLMKTELTALPKYAHLRSHYFNRITHDTEVDLASDQFDEGRDRELVPCGKVATREGVLSDPDTRRKYEMLKRKLCQKFNVWD
ncbi:MAG: hypothetical protein KGI60_00535 [Patescibacteria group bacterium]|nr:hypothetical protein [Patescibacteria group bacterium]